MPRTCEAVLPGEVPAQADDGEQSRRSAVARLVPTDLDDTELRRLTRLASAVTGLPLVTVNVLDGDEQRQLATHGFVGGPSPRADSMCAATVRAGCSVVLEDVQRDERFRTSPWVDGRLGAVRAYAASVLRTGTGDVLGTLCTFAEHPQRVGEDQVRLLEDLADQVVALLEARRTATDAALREELLTALLQSLDVGVVACDGDGRLTLFNDTARRWHGMPADPAVDPASFPQRYDLREAGGRRPLPLEQVPLLRALREGAVRDAEIVIAPPGLPQVRVLTTGRSVVAPDGRHLGAVVAMSDITALRQREQAVATSEARFRATFEHGLVGMAVCDSGRVLQVNEALCTLLGAAPADLLGQRLAVSGDALLPEQGRGEVQLRRQDGEPVWAAVAVVALPGEDGRQLTLLQVEDVSERRAAVERLTHLAMHDALTGLPNRALLLERLAQATASARRLGATTALLFVDLDGFKQINDEQGHEVGDRLLVHTARRLEHAVRLGDTVARLGGDEFVVLCERVGGADEAEEVARRLAERLARPLVLDGGAITVSASIGVAVAGPDDDAARLLHAADAAMYRVKQARPER